MLFRRQLWPSIQRGAKFFNFDSVRSTFRNYSTLDVSRQLSNDVLPKGSGNGPFAETPSFEVIGDVGDLINVTMPQSSSIFIKSGTLVASNGDLNSLSSSLTTINGVPYTELISPIATSILVNNASSSYSTIEVTKDEPWVILGTDQLTGWTGLNLRLQSLDLTGNKTSIECMGKGKVLVNGEENLARVFLDPHESIYVDPRSLVAFNTDIKFVVASNESNTWSLLHSNISKVLRIVQSLSVVRSLIRWGNLLASQSKAYINRTLQRLGVEAYVFKGKHFWHILKNFLRVNVYNILRRKPIYVAAKGPGEILIHNSRRLPREIFSKSKLDKILHSKY